MGKILCPPGVICSARGKQKQNLDSNSQENQDSENLAANFINSQENISGQKDLASNSSDAQKEEFVLVDKTEVENYLLYKLSGNQQGVKKDFLLSTDSSSNPLLKISGIIDAQFPLPKKESLSNLKNVRYGVRQGTFVLNFLPNNKVLAPIAVSRSNYIKSADIINKSKSEQTKSRHLNFESRFDLQNTNIQIRSFVRWSLKKDMVILTQYSVFTNPVDRKVSEIYSGIVINLDRFLGIMNSLDLSDLSLNVTVFPPRPGTS